MGIMTKKGKMFLRFELNGTVLRTLDSSQITGEIVIGRNSQCDWVIPATDRSASNRHARLFRKRGALYIQDLGSRNGIFFKGEKIESRKLAVGDEYTVGDCRLYVEPPRQELPASSDNRNRLEQLNGAAKGRVYDLIADTVRIGSSSVCEIVLNDSVVSQVQAQIEQKEDGSAWIRDLGSRNGTLVNGDRLSRDANDTGRMLQDGDIITISYIELRFLDKFVPHVRSHLGLKIAAVLLTTALLLGGYFAWRTVKPSAQRRLDFARICAARRDFAGARKHLESAKDAKGADLRRYEIADLVSRIDQWEKTLSGWQKAQQLMEQKKWLSANNVLTPLLSSDLEAWRWNDTDAGEAKALAISVKALLDIYLEGRTLLVREDSTLKQLTEIQQRLNAEIKKNADRRQEYFRLLRSSAADISEELNQTCADISSLETTLLEVAKNSDLGEALRKLETRYGQITKRIGERKKAGLRCSPRIGLFYSDISLPLRKLSEAQQTLEANYRAAAELRFGDIKAQLPLPAVEECNVHPVLTDLRMMLQTLNGQLGENAKQLTAFSRTLRENSLDPGTTPECIRRITSDRILAQVLACDTLNGDIPRWSRKAGSGEYDRVLGMEPFFEYLRLLPDAFDSGTLAEFGFVPDIYAARKSYSLLSSYLKFMEKPGVAMIRDCKGADNKALKLALYADDRLNDRDELVRKLVALSRRHDDRRGIIAGGMALLLAADKSALPKDFEAEVAKKVRNLREKLATAQKTDVSPEEMLKNRRILLETGLPGDPFIKQAWADTRSAEVGK